MCYTNHALDQFLEDLLAIGIDASSIVRIGSKSTQRTRPLAISEQKSNFKMSPASWKIINRLEETAESKESELLESFGNYKHTSSNIALILEYLEFAEPSFFEALSIPEDDSGMKKVGKKGKTLKKDYLYDRWIQGEDAGVFQQSFSSRYIPAWELSKNQRLEKNNMWIRALLEERAESLVTHASQFSRVQKQLDLVWGEKTRQILKRKRIILPVLLVQPGINLRTAFLCGEGRSVGVWRCCSVLGVINKRAVPLLLHIVIRIIVNGSLYT